MLLLFSVRVVIVSHYRFNHFVVDGKSAMDFMHHWAGMVRALGYSESVCKSGKVPTAAHQRELMSSSKPPTAEYIPAGYRLLSSPAADLPLLPLGPEATRAKIFHFPRCKIDALKSLLHSHLLETEFVSTNDVISAIMFAAISTARQILPTQVLKCGYALDARPRMSPPLSPGYVGNGNFIALLECSAEQVLHAHEAGHERELAGLALRFRATTSSMTAQELSKILAWIQSQPYDKKITKSFRAFCGSDLSITNWCSFGLYDLDFGVGTPVYAGVPQLTAGLATFSSDGILVLTSSAKEDGSVDAIISLRKEHMERLESDHQFRRHLTSL